MTEQSIRGLIDTELMQVVAWAQDEQRVRAEQRKHETVAKIKELAGAVGLSVTINGKRGRPAKARAETNAGKGAK